MPDSLAFGLWPGDGFQSDYVKRHSDNIAAGTLLSLNSTDNPFGAFRGQKGARSHGNAGIPGILGNVVCVTYRI